MGEIHDSDPGGGLWVKHALVRADCVEWLAKCPDGRFDSVVTDPPYGLKFMGKDWDKVLPDPTVWTELLRVMKPGAHALVFGGTRTFHRLAVAIEDAGFEIRDCVMWVYGSGFPKSMDVSKAIDKADRGVPQGGKDPTSPNHGKYKTQATEGKRSEFDQGKGFGAGPGQFMREKGSLVNRELTDDAKQWEGWGTALKPAWEPIIVARKPLIGTVAANVLEHGTGGLNIDACRVGTQGATRRSGQVEYPKNPDGTEDRSKCWARTGHSVVDVLTGRFPANLIHDGSEEVTDSFPETKGGSMSRYFYCAKASKKERGKGNTHPTVKPQALLRYLIRLVTPPGGIVLDPFLGSGSTILAAEEEGFQALGIERDQDNFEIAKARILQTLSEDRLLVRD